MKPTRRFVVALAILAPIWIILLVIDRSLGENTDPHLLLILYVLSIPVLILSVPKGFRRRSIVAITRVSLLLGLATCLWAFWAVSSVRVRPATPYGAAVSILRIIGSAGETFRSGVVKDEDGDGIGEYGTLREMGGLDPLPGSGVPCEPPFIPSDFASSWAHGYSVSLALGTEACTEITDVNAAEIAYFVTAWPVKYSKGDRYSRKSLVVDQSGVIRAKDNGGLPGTCEAIAGEKPWPALDQYPPGGLLSRLRWVFRDRRPSPGR